MTANTPLLPTYGDIQQRLLDKREITDYQCSRCSNPFGDLRFAYADPNLSDKAFTCIFHTTCVPNSETDLEKICEHCQQSFKKHTFKYYPATADYNTNPSFSLENHHFNARSSKRVKITSNCSISRRTLCIVSCVAIVLLVGAGGTAWFFLENKA